MYLVFGRDKFWQVSVDGRTFRTAGTNEASAMVEVYGKHFHPDVERSAASALAVWQPKAERLRKGTTEREVTRKEGKLGDRITRRYVLLTFPDGEAVECSSHEVKQRIDAKISAELGPMPVVPQSHAWQPWKADAGAVAEEVRGWVAVAYDADGSSRSLDVDLSDWNFGAPIGAITVTLNRFAQDGWSLISANEDKGLYIGADASNEAFPARVRLLLGRPRAVDRGGS